MGLARGQEEADWIAQGIDQGMDLGAQSAFAAADRFVFAGFFWLTPPALGYSAIPARFPLCQCRGVV